MMKKKGKESPKSNDQSPMEEAAQPATGTVALPGAGEFKVLRRDQVRPDPNQPRKVFDEAKLNELAESIRAQGIIQPLLVRWMEPALKIHEPDLVNNNWQAVDPTGKVMFEGDELQVKTFAKWDTEGFFQLVDGERRWRAADLAGLAEVPCVVRPMDDRAVFNAQWTANQARENLLAIEEAKSFAAQIAARKETDPSFNAEKLAAELGIARGTVYNRLTLTRLTEPVLAALTAGTIQATQAGLIAMIPDPQQQEKLLKKISNEDDWQFPYSFRDIEELIEEEYCKQLKDAPFDSKVLLPDWERVANVQEFHAGACTDCPLRTENMKEAFPHIKNGNVCTRPECFQAKCKAYFADEAAEAERKGQKVLTKKEFKAVKSQYVAADEYDYQLGGYTNWGELMGKKAPEPVLIVTEAGLKKVYPKEQAIEAAKKNGSKIKSEEVIAEAEAKSEEAQRRRETRRALVLECAPMLLKSLAKMKDSEALLMVSEMILSLDWPDHELEAELMDKCKGKTLALARCFADSESSPVIHTGEWDKNNVALWKRAGVDLIAEEKKRENDAAPALPLKNGEGKQKELLSVKKTKLTPAKRALIAATAKARWAKAKAAGAAK